MYRNTTLFLAAVFILSALLSSCYDILRDRDRVVHEVYNVPGEFIIRGPVYTINPSKFKLPNLIARRTRIQVNGDTVTFQPRVENIGRVASGQFNVHLNVDLTDNDGNASEHDLGAMPWSPLAAGSDQRVDHSPTLSITGLARPIAVQITVTVDTPVDTGGQVWETNETDNIRVDNSNPNNPNLPLYIY